MNTCDFDIYTGLYFGNIHFTSTLGFVISTALTLIGIQYLIRISFLPSEIVIETLIYESTEIFIESKLLLSLNKF